MNTSSLKREDILSQYHMACAHLNLSADLVRLTCGGASVLHGIRNSTADIDLEVSPLIFKKITRDPKYVVEQGLFSPYIQFSDLITVHQSDPFGPVAMIEGVHVVSIPKLHKFYDLLSRNVYRPTAKREQDLKTLGVIRTMFAGGQ